MNIALLAVGTRGDVQPFIALALGLQEAGFSPLIISAKNEEAFVRSFGIPFHSLNVDIQKIMDNQEVHEMAKGDSPLAFAKSHLESSKALHGIMLAVQHEIWAAVQNVDAIVYHPGMQNAYLMAQELGIPAIMASPFPFAPTSAYPAILFYDKIRLKGLLGNIVNRITHAAFERVFWMLSRSAAVDFWKKQNKPHRAKLTPPSRLQAESGQPVLLAYSPHIFSQQKEWSENITVTGYWTLPENQEYAPPADLAEFLANGKPPIYVGFGSIKDKATFRQTVELVAQAVERLGERAVIGLGWSSADAVELSLPKSVMLIGNVPHSWLFPRVSAVVHHGGAGTTAAGLIAGKPTLIIPHTADQPAWGLRVWELGVGAKPIPKKKLTQENLEAALKELLQPRVIAEAGRLGETLRTENGVRKAVGIIKKNLYHHSSISYHYAS
jgi:sterol 3beta-glucosyltransferase